jgi:cytochrome b
MLGSTTARFRDFLHPPSRIVGYLKGRDANKWYAGHNPAGGLMVAALILVLLAQVGTGLFANDGVRFRGPLALLVSEDTSSRLTDVHGLVFESILVLVWCHIVAVGFYLLVKGHNLISPMVTGKKRQEHVPPNSNLIFVRSYIALLLFAVSAGIAVWVMAQGGYAL